MIQGESLGAGRSAPPVVVLAGHPGRLEPIHLAQWLDVKECRAALTIALQAHLQSRASHSSMD